ncbi:MAG: EamA family transporter [Bacteroidota bacterium]
MELTINLSKKSWQWLSLSVLALIWGSSFIFIKRGLESFTDMQVAAFRVFISFIFLLPFAIQRFKKLKKRHFKPLLLVGFIGNGIPSFLFTKAQTQVSSSLAGMLNSMVPMFALIIGYLFYRVHAKSKNISGVFLGLIGASSLILINSNTTFSTESFYPLFILLATICYGFSVNEIKQNLSDLDGVSIVAFAFFFIGPFAGIYLFNSDYSFALSTPDYIQNLSYIFLLAVLSSIIATIMFNYLIKHTTALFAASVTYLIPIVAILWGLLDGEQISFYQLLSIGVILVGVRLVNKK